MDDLPTLVLRASRCCLELLHDLNNFSPVEGVSLTLHMGVGAGKLSSFYAGGYNSKWEYFVAGPPIEQMSDAAEEATSGELVLSTHAYELLDRDARLNELYSFEGRLLESTQFLLTGIAIRAGDPGPSFENDPERRTRGLEGSAEPNLFRDLQPYMKKPPGGGTTRQLLDVLKCFVPDLVEERLATGQSGAWVSEHRKLVSIFMKILGLGPKPCDVEDLQQIHQVVRAVQMAIHKLDGTITRLICDDKGVRFLIAFGLPGHLHEDDERRAVLASLDVVAALSKIPGYGADPAAGNNATVGCAIGVTTGRVFCGEAGWERYRVEYTLAGAKVNLAARLMQAASKERDKAASFGGRSGVIYVEHETYQAAVRDETCEFLALTPIKVKGKEELVKIYEPVPLEDRAAASSRFRNTRGPLGRNTPPNLGHSGTINAGLLDEASKSSGPFGRRSFYGGASGGGSRATGPRPTRSRSETAERKVAQKTLGRVAEQAKIKEVLLSMRDEQNSNAIMLSGESGMGKTHLVGVLHELASQTLWDDAPCEVGYLFNASKPIEQMTPFFMWQAIFGRLFCNETLLRLKELSAQVTAAGSKPKEPAFPAGLESSKTMGDIVKAAERAERAERERPNIIDKVRQHEGGRRRASTEDSVLPPAPMGADSAFGGMRGVNSVDGTRRGPTSAASESSKVRITDSGSRDGRGSMATPSMRKSSEAQGLDVSSKGLFSPRRLLPAHSQATAAGDGMLDEHAPPPSPLSPPPSPPPSPSLPPSPPLSPPEDGSGSISGSDKPPKKKEGFLSRRFSLKGKRDKDKEPASSSEKGSSVSASASGGAGSSSGDMGGEERSTVEAKQPETKRSSLKQSGPADMASRAADTVSHGKPHHVGDKRGSLKSALKSEMKQVAISAPQPAIDSSQPQLHARWHMSGPPAGGLGCLGAGFPVHTSIGPPPTFARLLTPLDSFRIRREKAASAEQAAGPSSAGSSSMARLDEQPAKSAMRSDGVYTPNISRQPSKPKNWPWHKSWTEAVATVLAYQLPESEQDGRFSIRPGVDDDLLSDEDVINLAPLLSPVLPLHIEDNEVTKNMADDAKMATRIDLMVKVLKAKLGGAMNVLALEDVHWMDTGSWALLKKVLDEVKPLTVVCTSRPMDAKKTPKEYNEILKGKRNTLMQLEGLHKKDVQDMLCSMFKVDEMEESIVDIVNDKSSGNPLWTKEFALSMEEGRVIEISEGRCKVGRDSNGNKLELSKMDFPSSVETLITSRIDRQPPSHQMVMKVASVISTGNAFTSAVLRTMLKVGDIKMGATVGGTDSIKVACEALCAAGMLMRAEGFKEGDARFEQYLFKHMSIKDVSYSLLPEELKTKLHRAAAIYYEDKRKANRVQRRGSVTRESMMPQGVKSKSTKDDELVLLLAHHWTRAIGVKKDKQAEEATTQAVSYLTLAGDRALETNSEIEAGKLFGEALGLAMKTDTLVGQRGSLQKRLGWCTLKNGKLEEGRELLMQAVINMGGEAKVVSPRTAQSISDAEPPPPDLKWRYRRQLMEQYRLRLAGVVPTRARRRDADDPEAQAIELAEAYAALGKAFFDDHLVEEASYCVMRALNLGLRLSTVTPVVARAYASLMLIAASSIGGGRSSARRYKRKALESCRNLDELGNLGATQMAAAVVSAGQATWADAVQNLAEATQICDDLHDKRSWEECVSHSAHLEFYRGNFAQSRELYEKAMASGLERNDKQIINRCQAGIAGVLLATNELAEAVKILEKTNSNGQCALGYLRSGRHQEALEKALMVKDKFKGRRTKYYVLKAFASTAEVILKLLELARGLERRKQRAERSGIGGGSSGKGSGGSDRKSRDRHASAMGTSPGRLSSWSQSMRSIVDNVAEGASTKRVSQVSGSTNDAVRIDDLPKLTLIAQEWIDKLLQFGKVYAVAMPRALLLRGQLLMLTGRGTGKARAATAQLRKSLACARKQQMPYEEGLALYELGKHAAHPSDAMRYLSQALDNFTRTGAVYDQKRAEQQIAGRRANKSSSSLLVTQALQDGVEQHNEEQEADEGEAGADNGEGIGPLASEPGALGATDTSEAGSLGATDASTSSARTPHASISLEPAAPSGVARDQPSVSVDSAGASVVAPGGPVGLPTRTPTASIDAADSTTPASQQQPIPRTGSKVSFSSLTDGNVRI